MFFYIFILFIFLLLFFYNYKNLLQLIILLEFFSFVILFDLILFETLNSSFLILLFSIFVVEGVLALSGMILLVSFTGSDYISSTYLLKL